jgi:thioredoxin 1
VSLDELDEIRRKKMEKLMSEKKEPSLPKVDYPNKPVILSDSTLDAALNQYPLLIVDAWAEWCGPCRMIAPAIEDLAKELSGRAVFGKLNVDDNMQTANKYRISAIPSLLVFKNGKLIDKLVGAYPKATLAAKIQKYL